MPKAEVSFSELRDDWVRGADLMARLIDQSSQGAPALVGFPAPWIVLFEHFGARWSDAIPSPHFVPLISDLSAEALVEAVGHAQSLGQLRTLVEGVAALDPLIADVLHKLDRRPRIAPRAQGGVIPFTGWQSYGRPEVLAFEARALDHAVARSSRAVLLPCARRRPYGTSKTHKRLAKGLVGREVEGADQIVVSSLGVIPSALWEDPVVLAYDSGVPDIYRVLRLMRAFFTRARYAVVVDCLEFEPYRDCLRIIAREGLVGAVEAGPDRKIKKLPQP
jgi:hypothetical protein